MSNVPEAEKEITIEPAETSIANAENLESQPEAIESAASGNEPVQEPIEEQQSLPEASEEVSETSEESPKKHQTKEEIIESLSDLVNGALDEAKERIESLKAAFYRIRKTEIEELKTTFLQEGGIIDNFIVEADNIEEKFKGLLNTYKEKRAKQLEELEAIKQRNLEEKQQLLEDLKSLTENPDDVGRNYPEFQAIQDKWKEITLLPQTQVTELWKSYHHYVENFYDLLKINKELRDYDYKVNLARKEVLCEAAEKLAAEEDVVSAFHQLQNLHNEWREIGPVAREQREEIWNRFKEASTVVNKRHQSHFEAIKVLETEAEQRKVILCETVESFDLAQLQSHTDWEEKTQAILEAQQAWKEIGFASKRMNNLLYERFRTACNHFFEAKSEFFKSLKEGMNENLEKKRQLCEKAEELKDSSDWKMTTDQLIQLQKEWKEVGSVARKHSDIVWKRFIGACDHFFEQKEKYFAEQKSAEHQNLEKKQDVIEQLKAISQEDDAAEATPKVRQLIEQWKEIGHVPFKEKDKLFKQYNAELDRLFSSFQIREKKSRLRSFAESVSSIVDEGIRRNERDKLIYAYEAMKNELRTYQNNIGFLTANSKSGNSLVREIEKKIEKLKADIETVAEKIAIIDRKEA